MSSAVSPRISTFSGSGLYKKYDPSVIQAQHVQRLRVNRVAIVQALRVDHVYPKLTELGVLSEQEVQLISQSGKTQQEKTRLLIDLLPNKGKSVDWYGGFREALKHPDTRMADIRRKYQILIEFLDNTLIPIPPKRPAKSLSVVSSIDDKATKSSYPRYDPLPNISKGTSPETFPDGAHSTENNSRLDTSGYPSRSEKSREDVIDEREEMAPQTNEQTPQQTPQHTAKQTPQGDAPLNQRTLVSGYFHRQVTMPENFKALVEEPAEHFERLKNSENEEDKRLLSTEQEVLERARAVEVVFALNRRQKLPPGVELCFSHAVDDMLRDSQNYHIYLKYFQVLANRYNLEVIRDLTTSYTGFVSKLEDASDDEERKQVVTAGFSLFEFACQAGLYVKAEGIMLELMRYLSTCSSIENWMAVWQGLIHLQTISNSNGYFRDADQWYVLASDMGEKVKLMSFGQDLLDESQLFIELSITNREQGSVSAAYSWAQSALKEVDDDNYIGQVDVLCNAAIAYSMQWNVKQAEKLLVQAVRIARHEFGEYSPQYVRALVHLVSYCNEFRPDGNSVAIAQRAVEIAETIFAGSATLQRANAHEALARALVAAQLHVDDTYTNAALLAYRMAMDVLPSLHPKFASFRMTNAHVLLCKAGEVGEEEREGVLMQAEEEAKAALQIYKSYWGDYSLKLAQAYCILAQIYARMDNKKETAEEMLRGAYTIYVTSVPPTSNYQALLRATIGTFYKSTGKPLQAIDYLTSSVKALSSCGVFLRWAHVAYESLIGALRATSQVADADSYQLMHVDWLKKNPRPSTELSWQHLHAEPGSFGDFRQDFFALATRLQKAKRGLKNFMKK